MRIIRLLCKIHHVKDPYRLRKNVNVIALVTGSPYKKREINNVVIYSNCYLLYFSSDIAIRHATPRRSMHGIRRSRHLLSSVHIHKCMGRRRRRHRRRTSPLQLHLIGRDDIVYLSARAGPPLRTSAGKIRWVRPVRGPCRGYVCSPGTVPLPVLLARDKESARDKGVEPEAVIALAKWKIRAVSVSEAYLRACAFASAATKGKKD